MEDPDIAQLRSRKHFTREEVNVLLDVIQNLRGETRTTALRHRGPSFDLFFTISQHEPSPKDSCLAS